MPTVRVDSAEGLLQAAYRDLDLVSGALRSAGSPSDSDAASTFNWLENGEWLSLADKIGAEKVFFVRDNPVVVFASAQGNASDVWQRFFRDAWCMARPMVLFLATPGELAVYDLTKGPSRTGDSTDRSERMIGTARSAVEVQQKLAMFRREQIESGRLFEEYHFGDVRADSALVGDIQTVRRRLMAPGFDLDPTCANSLIGRSLFIRYLEARGVLDAKYFRKVAKGTPAWIKCLESAPAKDSFGEPSPLFPHVLSHKGFADALFDRVAVDFNGDVFPVDDNERKLVAPKHLKLLKELLLGQAEPSLFFFAYQFDIVPIELISNIYEEFLRSRDGGKSSEGSYYTRSSLVEFLLNQTLTESLLDTKPRIMDPACGSGIFLVESFRRLVRHRVKQLGHRPSADDLHTILRDQIAGIDINPEAVRVAAFSLYLAMLHYLDPPTIRNNRLPCLVYPQGGVREPKKKYFDILVAGNAFEIENSVADEGVRSRFGSACAEIVVGNPPWGTPKSNGTDARSDALAKESREGASRWCKAHLRDVGNKELSQAFIHRTMDLLKENGEAALLVSTGVFFKRHKNSQTFRQQWLEQATLQQVVNFAAVRHFFFQRPKQPTSKRGNATEKEGAISPFASVRFQKSPPELDYRFQYWSAKRTAFVECAEVVVLSRTDVHWVSQHDLLQDERLWKVYWWGGHRDVAFLQRLSLETTLGKAMKLSEDRVGRGWEKGTDDADWLSEYDALPTRKFRRYGSLQKSDFASPPEHAYRLGDRRCYDGLRILIKRGISEKGKDKGRIDSRLENDQFSFQHSIYGIPLGDALEFPTAKFLLGLMWSSLARYFLFQTSGSWGPWHNDLRPESILQIPVRLPITPSAWESALSIVDSLREFTVSQANGGSTDKGHRKRKKAAGTSSQQLLQFEGAEPDLSASDHNDLPSGNDVRTLEASLDNVLFDIYELSEEERDLIREMCDLGLDHMYRGRNSEAVKRLQVHPNERRIGRRTDLARTKGIAVELRDYIRVFLELWEPRLKPQKGWLRWRVVLGDSKATMLAIIFSTESADDRLAVPTDDDESAWQWILNDLAQSCGQQAWAREIYIDGMLRLVTPHDMVILKRNERRLWTRTAAREDAEATMADVLFRSTKPINRKRN